MASSPPNVLPWIMIVITIENDEDYLSIPKVINIKKKRIAQKKLPGMDAIASL